jgi:homocysteine S-methyltransferase
VIVDGGLGAELAARGFRFTTRLWSGEAILTRPDLLTAIHRAYLDAGAQVLSTATYQLSHATLRELGYADAAIDDVFARGVGLARGAIAARRAETGACGEWIVAGSLGPYGATLGDGSEYAGTRHLEDDALYAFHAQRARSMLRAQPDVFLFETIPTLAEGLVIAAIARDLQLERVWISFSCSDGAHTCGGDRMSDVAAALEVFACVDAIGVNCTAPAAIAPLVGALKAVTAKPLVACPNLGQHWESDAHALTGGATETDFERLVPTWMELGVTHIGGCCGVGPSAIAAVARVLRKRA